MKNFEKRLHQVIVSSVEALREDTNMGSKGARDALILNIFNATVKIFTDLTPDKLSNPCDKILQLED